MVLAAALCGCQDTPDPVPNYREYAYVSNSGSNNVTVDRGVHFRVPGPAEVGSDGFTETGVAQNALA